MTELHILCCAKQKHCDTWTMSLSYFILYHKDLAGHNELMCPPLCHGENGYFTSTFTQLHLLLKTCMTNHHCKLLHTKLNVG